MAWIRDNWFWITVFILFLWMLTKMHGGHGHGGHGSGDHQGHRDRNDGPADHGHHTAGRTPPTTPEDPHAEH